MYECPDCGELIDHVEYERQFTRFESGKFDGDYEPFNDGEDPTTTEFLCSHCGVSLGTTEEELAQYYTDKGEEE